MHMDSNVLKELFSPDSNFMMPEDSDPSEEGEAESTHSESNGEPNLYGLNFETVEGDIFMQLAQKERYLLLAAEAGKDLLEKNKILNAQYEKLKVENATVVEALEQQCFTLRKELKQREEVHSSRIQELHSDIDMVRDQLESVQQSSSSLEKYHKVKLEELSVQNEVLNGELSQVKNRNQELSFQVDTLRKRIEGRSSRNGFIDGEEREAYNEMDDVRHLREQNLLLQQQKRCLEESISECIADREAMARDNEAAKLKIANLDQELSTMKQKAVLFQEELDESRHSNSMLKEQLEEYILKASTTGPRQVNKSLYDELEFTLSETDMSLVTKLQGSTPIGGRFRPLASSSHHGLHALKRRRDFSAGESSESDEEEENGEYVIQHDVVSCDEKVSPSKSEVTGNPAELGEFLADCWRKLSHMHTSLLRHYKTNDSDFSGATDGDVCGANKVVTSPSELSALVDQLERLVHKILLRAECNGEDSSKGERMSLDTNEGSDKLSQISGSQHEMEALEHQVSQLNRKLNEVRQEAEKSKREVVVLKGSLREKEDEISGLSQKVNYEGRELKNLKEERDLLLATANIEDTLKKSILDREAALQRENQSLLELEQMRSDMKKLNDQLVDAIQQKIELSEQLDEWQIDVAALIEKQLHSKLKGGDTKKGRRKPFFNTRWNWGTLKTAVAKEG